jgi:DNA-binding transcriptional LysR family regulator
MDAANPARQMALVRKPRFCGNLGEAEFSLRNQSSGQSNGHIGRRLRLRDLHVFFTVVRCGSMAKAAVALRISQPSISIQIGDLEHALGVRLFDRTPRGVELTSYGEALLRRGQAAFDELKQGIRDIDFLADPTAGEVRLGCSEPIRPGLLPPIVELRGEHKAEILLDDRVRVIAGAESRWANRSKIDIAELSDELWIMTPPETPLAAIIESAFRASGPKCHLETYSVHLRNHLVGTGQFVAATLGSVARLNAEPFRLKALPAALPRARIP